ncbi:glycoside hydrolase family 15 protein [Paraburkholderia sprentiae WSM5005]|uniref:Glycoside hydrolase family 15 protein n=1 Tax=Paraburkholderia sprentiae WSM5005 TaxID=754502 RepID=A0A1I9YFT5_9BURK|nr:glycoside hydrolase family 15 protein [Paraburkholderia sprentiae]APA85168.1 glycoside hydrolase family 15 protein [Paraburkholderia sprentiae WSM5005]
MSRAIEDYALLGDGETAALVSRDGSVDWLCWPRFDGGACFAALLGTADNGCWSIAPVDRAIHQRRRYQQDTLVVETDFEVDSGAVRVIDFMPLGDGPSSLVRIVTGLRGIVRMRSRLRLRFDYGLLSPWIARVDGTVQARVGPDLVVLHTDVQLNVNHESVDAVFDVEAGKRVAFCIRYGSSHEPAPERLDAESALLATQRHWRKWIGQFDNTRTTWPNEVRRSLLTLKALIYRKTGAIVAAPTTSLPEAPAGQLNWDYRYCWLRDTSFALVALLNAGLHEEALAWRDWLLLAISGSPENIRVMYRVDGNRHLHERTIDWLQGYRYASPVRVGNAAAAQHQIDILGEIIDCLSVARRAGLPSPSHEEEIERRIVEHLETVWNTRGSGIWESRSEPHHYTYSRVMAWVAVDRFITHRSTGDPPASPLEERLRALRETIHEEVCREAWNDGLGTFTQYYGSETLDASLLLMPLVGFLPADDPRMASTIDTIRRELTEGGLIRRRKKDPRGPNEGAFLACSCWMADCLKMQGRDSEAREQFERVLAVANDLGLFSEQYNTQHRQMAGNFPQALTHLAVVNTAIGLCGPALRRGGG